MNVDHIHYVAAMHASRPNVSKLETKQRHRPIQGRSRARPGPSPARPVLACTGKWAIGYLGGQAGFEFVTSCVGQSLSIVHLHSSTRDPVAIAEDAGVRSSTHSAAYSSIGRRVSDLSYLPARQPIRPSQSTSQSVTWPSSSPWIPSPAGKGAVGFTTN